MKTYEPIDFDGYIAVTQALLTTPGTVDDLRQANDCVSRAIEVRPRDGRAWLLKSQTLSLLEDHTAALAAAEMAIRYLPDSAEAHYVRATVLVDLGRYEEALEGIECAFSRLEDGERWVSEDLFYEQASALEALNRQEDALAAFEQGLKQFPDSNLLRSGLEPLSRASVRGRLRLITGGKTPV